ncbi:MBL fold metallo-hydrolase [Paenibacillus sp. VCA1]|uniref:MBL fold metallo-hydrolase n=1 Tax=Paenibacillus sp. VCA1 TaxID=3039148 RepID=UPI00287199CC|nr:MBL fold metallo-hydrolase [Paenibacillus sp. VCA1]MDR9854795.1 MBL fold metallo-hydrolase [Paenibacillus sp. VCA1]
MNINPSNHESRIHMLEIASFVMGKTEVIHPVLIHDRERAVLVDAGYPGQIAKFAEALSPYGLGLQDVTQVIITHQDLDHIGNLPAMLEQSKRGIEVLASAEEKPYIEGAKMILKITPEALAAAEAMIPPGVSDAWKQAFLSMLKNPPKSPVHRVIHDGQILPLCGGIEVIATSGHTPGHISLYHIPSKTLIAADALRVADGRLCGPDPDQTLDMERAKASVKKLADYDIETVICYHGGLYQDGNISQTLRKLAAG